LIEGSGKHPVHGFGPAVVVMLLPAEVVVDVIVGVVVVVKKLVVVIVMFGMQCVEFKEHVLEFLATAVIY
jgi:hypothetical protein